MCNDECTNHLNSCFRKQIYKRFLGIFNYEMNVLESKNDIQFKNIAKKYWNHQILTLEFENALGK